MDLIFYLVLIIAIVIIAICLIKYSERRWWEKYNECPNNFPFKHHGKTLWYSRSCAVAVFVFCKNALGEWCVLANQRGSGAPDYRFFWNGICGYVDYNESCEQTAIREINEETGISIPIESLQFETVNSDPVNSNKQNITIRYFAIIDDKTTDCDSLKPTITNRGEKNEVAAVGWIPVSALSEHKWAFGHKEIIENLIETRIVK